MTQSIEPGIYRHFRTRNTYEVIGVARHTETMETMVVYRALYESPEFGPDAIWVRPLAMFTENVTLDGKTIPRFTRVTE